MAGLGVPPDSTCERGFGPKVVRMVLNLNRWLASRRRSLAYPGAFFSLRSTWAL